MKPPGYTVKDLLYYTGLFAGIIAVYLALAPFGVHPIIRLVGGLIVGVGAGWLLEKAYLSAKAGGEDREPPR